MSDPAAGELDKATAAAFDVLDRHMAALNTRNATALISMAGGRHNFAPASPREAYLTGGAASLKSARALPCAIFAAVSGGRSASQRRYPAMMSP